MLTAGGRTMTAELEELKAMWLDLRAHVDQLAVERQQYQDFFEQSSEAYVVTDEYGTIADANGAAVDILQRRKRNLRGKPLVALVALERRTEFRQRLRALRERAPAAERAWRTIFVAPELRTEVQLNVRLIERTGSVGGICWRLEALA
jgi:PAS domain S-box-containing protein